MAATAAARADADGGDPKPIVDLGGLLDRATSVLQVDGDHVVFVPSHHHGDHDDDHVDAKGTAAAGGPVTHEGFTTYGDAMARPRYDVLLVASDGIEQMRPFIERAAAAAEAAGAPALSVGRGTIPADSALAHGEIHVSVSSSSPCEGSWLGCGGPVIDDGVVQAGRMWINPRVLEGDPARADNTVRHELGHTLGLGHYNGVYADRLQTMHASSFEAQVYEAGDRAGFRFVTGNEGPDPEMAPPTPPPAAAAARTPPSAPPQEIDPFGAIELAAPGPFGLAVAGWASDPDAASPVSVLVTVDGAPIETLANRDRTDGTRNGFEVLHPVPPGPHELCVLLRNVGAGSDVSLGCHVVETSGRSIGRVGVQTV